MASPIVATRFSTIADALQQRLDRTPEQVAFRFIAVGAPVQELSYRQLHAAASRLQALLVQRHAPGARLILMYPPGLEFVIALFATLLAGQVAVPVVPPRGRRDAGPLGAIIANCDAAAILSCKQENYRQRMGEALAGQLPWLDTDTDADAVAVAAAAPAPTGPAASPGALALIQYTSGSTSTPRGVMLSHAVLSANLEMIADAMGFTPEDQGFSWLPHFHDMGLIGAILAPVYVGFPITLMAPAAFMSEPLSWLQAMSDHGCNVCAAPNFAYEMCVRQISDDAARSLRLQHVRLMLCGAEPVRPDTLQRFNAKFAAAGLAPDVLFPSYGLAEATLFVAGGKLSPAWFENRFAPDQIANGKVVALAADKAADHNATGKPAAAWPLASMGPVHPAQQALIVGSDARVCAADEIGEIWLAGPNLGLGYWNNENATQQTFGAFLADGRGPFMRTGDAGFLHEGALYITGRLKDVIIVRGKNHYPQDIELVASRADPLVRADSVVAFASAPGTPGTDPGGDGLTLVFETVKPSTGSPALDDGVFERIAHAVARETGIRPGHLVAVGRAAIPRTSSGKVQRRRCAQMLADGTLLPQAQWHAHGTAQPSASGADVPADGAHDPRLPVPLALLPLYLASLPQEQCRQWLTQRICHHCAQMLQVPPGQIDVQEALYGIGLDSIEIAQAVNRLRRELQIELADALFWQAASITGLAQALTDLIAASPLAAEALPFRDLLQQVQTMSDDEVNAMMAELNASESEEIES